MNINYSSSNLLRAGLGILISLVILNVFIIDIFIIQNQLIPTGSKSVMTTNAKLESDVVNQSQSSLDICPNSCVVYIKDVERSLQKPRQIVVTSTQQPLISKASSLESMQVLEYFVPIGTGSVGADNWTDVAGARVAIDSTKYSGIKTVVFEASVHIPTGTGRSSVRLYNVTDKHPVWFSDVSLEGGDQKLLRSSPISLDSGEKVYQVQMMNTLKTPTSITQSRIKITVSK